MEQARLAANNQRKPVALNMIIKKRSNASHFRESRRRQTMGLYSNAMIQFRYSAFGLRLPEKMSPETGLAAMRKMIEVWRAYSRFSFLARFSGSLAMPISILENLVWI